MNIAGTECVSTDDAGCTKLSVNEKYCKASCDSTTEIEGENKKCICNHAGGYRDPTTSTKEVTC